LAINLYRQRDFSKPIHFGVKEQLNQKAWSLPIAAVSE